MPHNCVRFVVGAEKLNIFLAELDLGGCHRLLNMSYFTRTDDGRCQSLLMQQPGVSNPGIAFAPLGGKLAEAVDHSEVFFPIDQVVVVLHRYKPHPAIGLGDVMGDTFRPVCPKLTYSMLSSLAFSSTKRSSELISETLSERQMHLLFKY